MNVAFLFRIDTQAAVVFMDKAVSLFGSFKSVEFVLGVCLCPQNSTPYIDAYGYLARPGYANRFGLKFHRRVKLPRAFNNCTDISLVGGSEGNVM